MTKNGHKCNEAVGDAPAGGAPAPGIDGGEPRNAPAAHMQGFLSRAGMPPAEFLAVGRSEISGYGVEVLADRAPLEARGVRVITGQVGHLVFEDDRLSGVEVADGRVVARAAVFVQPANNPHPDGP